jgi:ABC-type phosphate transport system substrate-binding protein
MTGFRTRSLVSAFAVSAISAVAFIAPGTASAACSGANIKANGSSLQANAQKELWSKPFNEKCAGTEQVTYESTGSGPGLHSWFVGESPTEFKGFGPENAFVGTDQPPSQPQENEILTKGSAGAKVLSIPLLQAAVALPIHLPAGCTAEGGKKGKVKRLVLSDTTLQGIFAHTITTWAGVPGVVGASCDKSAPIVRVVRKEGSGTTAIVKKFLFEINRAAVDGTETWNELAEKNENLSWPAETEGLERAKKGSGIAEYVAANAGTIGYANLNEVRKVPAFTPAGLGGEGTAIFWAELQSKGSKYEDPSTDGETNTAANANCAGESYISLDKEGKQGKFPPASTEDVWNEVTANKTEKKSYPLCGFTYDLSLTKFSDFAGSDAGNEPTAPEVETVKNYLTYVLSTGQTALEGQDFLGLPVGKKGGNVLKIAQEGVAKIAF